MCDCTPPGTSHEYGHVIPTFMARSPGGRSPPDPPGPGSRAGSRSAVKTFCSMCQSCGCSAIASVNRSASAWLIAAIFSARVPVSGTGISS